MLDDPEGDSIYMVMEMCEKGVIMKIGLEEHAEPYEEEKCRLWFRDMILGIEYRKLWRDDEGTRKIYKTDSHWGNL